jgi:hypothetical protein
MSDVIQVREDVGDLVFTEYRYSIPLESIKAGPRGVLYWLLQLSEKKWFTTELMRRFIAVASRVAGFDPYRVVDDDDSPPLAGAAERG